MRVLVSAVGTRGDVQPAVAVAMETRRLGHDVRLCVPPNFVDQVAELGFEATPVGVEMRHRRSGPGPSPSTAPLTPEQLRQIRETMPDLITDQFEAVGSAARGCDLILGAGGHQYAAPSIAEVNGARYFNAVYAPVSLPSPDHAPPPAPGQAWDSGSPGENEQRWLDQARLWNERSLERINHNRARLGLRAVDDVLDHIRTDHPWLAADPTLAPVPSTPGKEVFQTGAWMLANSSPLPADVEAFLLQAGEPPVYLGFGSMPAPDGTSRTLIEAVRTIGRRAVLSQGWAELAPIDDAPDCIVIGDVNHQALFPRVAAVVHHGGAGTTTSAACAGVPQVIAPMFSDQFYWAERTRALGIGTALLGGALTTETLAVAMQDALRPAIAGRARSVAAAIDTDGARTAARRLAEAGADDRPSSAPRHGCVRRRPGRAGAAGSC